MTACISGCRTAPDDDGNRYPVRTEAPSLLCRRCEDRLQAWLEALPEKYADLPMFLTPGSAGPNPGSKVTKRAHPPVPLRLEVVDLLDSRLGRIWRGTEPAEDRHGALGILESWTRLVREERNIDAPQAQNTAQTPRGATNGSHPGSYAAGIRSGPQNGAQPVTVAGEAAFLLRHQLWICEQPWVTDFYDDIKTLHRSISDAVGDYRRPAVGRCYLSDGEGDCGGPLMPSRWGGVRCARCGTPWGIDDLRRLGLIMAKPEAMEGA